MAQQFSNANTGDKPADPFKTANLDNDVSLAQKIEDLNEFVSSCKFGMMTTRDANKSGNLVSRCMALVATVGIPPSFLSPSFHDHGLIFAVGERRD